MNKMILAGVCFLFLISMTTLGFSKDYDRDTPQGRPDYKGKPTNKYHKEYKGYPEKHDRREYKGRPDYHGHPGYRERPYDKHRQYMYHDYRELRYTYNGHWKSWDHWDRYARLRPEIYKHGRYYRESSHLMFRFCEPGTGACFFFSIGR